MRFQCPFCQGVVAVSNSDMGDDCQCGHCGEFVSVPTSRVATSAVISDFIIIEELGRGGMGVVYLAHQITLDRPAALKILAEAYVNNPEFVVDFIKEARAAAKLNHPHIVQAYAVGEDEGVYFFAMEHIDGETMKDYMKREGVIPVPFALEVTQQIAEALDYAWKEQRLVHRDIKPDNIMLTRKARAKLADLGLARVAGDIDDADSDEVMGTPQYISPEHLTGAEMDVRSDIYSLGATLFHLITGRFAFEGRTATDIARKHLEEQIISPQELNPNIPESVCRIIFKMMAKNPNDRYQSAEDLVEDLRLARQGKKPVSAPKAPQSKPRAKGGKQKQFSVKKGPGIKTGTYTAASSTGKHRSSPSTGKHLSSSSTGKHLSSSSIGIKRSKLPTETSSKMDKQQMKLEKERKAKNQMIVMGVIIFCVILGVVAFFVVRSMKEKPGKTTGGGTTAGSSKKTPAVTDYTKGADELLAYVKSNPAKDKEILSKIDSFFAKYPEPALDVEKTKRTEVMAVYIPIDEKRIKTAREDARRAHVSILQKRKDEETNKSDEAERIKRETALLKKQEDRRKQAAIDKKLKDEKRIKEYIAAQEKEKTQMRYLSLISSIQNNYDNAKKEFNPAVKESSTVADFYKSKAEEVTAWGKKMQKHLDTASKMWNAISNSGVKLKGTKLEINDSTCTVTNIKNGKVSVKTFDGKNLSFPLSSLRFVDLNKLLTKSAEEIVTDENNPVFHYLLASGHFLAAKKSAPDDWLEELDASTQAYLIRKLQDINEMNNSAARKKATQDIIRKAGRAACIKAKKACDNM